MVIAKGGVLDVIIVDERELNKYPSSKGNYGYLCFALDPYDKTLLGFAIYHSRSYYFRLYVGLSFVIGSFVGFLNLLSSSLTVVNGIAF